MIMEIKNMRTGTQKQTCFLRGLGQERNLSTDSILPINKERGYGFVWFGVWERDPRDQTQGHTHAKDVLDHGATKEWFPTDLLENCFSDLEDLDERKSCPLSETHRSTFTPASTNLNSREKQSSLLGVDGERCRILNYEFCLKALVMSLQVR